MTTAQKIEDIFDDVSWLHIAQEYFGKSSSWIYHKLYERDINGNGKPSKFSPDELQTLKKALVDISERIRTASERL